MASTIVDYKGVKFPELAKCPVPIEATVSYGRQRLVFKGVLTFDRTQGSWKFGEQFQIHLFCSDLPKLERRAENNGWTRIEIAVPFHVGEKMLRDSLATLNRRLHDFM